MAARASRRSSLCRSRQPRQYAETPPAEMFSRTVMAGNTASPLRSSGT